METEPLGASDAEYIDHLNHAIGLPQKVTVRSITLADSTLRFVRSLLESADVLPGNVEQALLAIDRYLVEVDPDERFEVRRTASQSEERVEGHA